MSIAGDILGSVVRDMVGDAMNAEAKAMKKSYEERTVSYTHLTLPTRS